MKHNFEAKVVDLHEQKNINDLDRKDIITKQGVDRAFTDKINRKHVYKRKMGQTTRRFEHENIERLKETYKNFENDRVFDFDPQYELSKFSEADFEQLADIDLSDLTDEMGPKIKEKANELQNLLKGIYQKHNIQKEPPKDLDSLLEYYNNLKADSQSILEAKRRAEAEKRGEIKIISVQDYKKEEPIKMDAEEREPEEID